jgi:hypothetical protein
VGWLVILFATFGLIGKHVLLIWDFIIRAPRQILRQKSPPRNHGNSGRSKE